MKAVNDNLTALKSYIDSMLCAISKAEKGSNAEDGYFIEKLERMANRLGYDLVAQDKPKPARMCYYIMETETNNDGEYIPCIVKEGVSGYFRTDWLWGTDIEIARQCAKEKNGALGLTAEEVDKIIVSSMANVR